MLLRAKLPPVSADQPAAFERANAASMPDAKTGLGSSLYHVWLAGRLPNDAQLGDYALDLQQISLTLSTMVMCDLRQPQ